MNLQFDDFMGRKILEKFDDLIARPTTGKASNYSKIRYKKCGMFKNEYFVYRLNFR